MCWLYYSTKFSGCARRILPGHFWISKEPTTRSPPMRSPSPSPPAAHFTCRPRQTHPLDLSQPVRPILSFRFTATATRHPVPKQLSPARRHSAECRSPPPTSAFTGKDILQCFSTPNPHRDILQYVAVSQTILHPAPRRCGHPPRRRPRRISPAARDGHAPPPSRCVTKQDGARGQGSSFSSRAICRRKTLRSCSREGSSHA